MIFHSNVFLEKLDVCFFEDFDSFMSNLSYWSSWSGGGTIWKDDFEKIGQICLNSLFPHTSVFFTQFFKKKFVIDDRVIYDVQRVHKRGGHNNFEAFTVHYPSLIDDLFSRGLITKKCKDLIFDDLCRIYIPTLLFNKYIARIETFESANFKDNCKKYFSPNAYYRIWRNVLCVPIYMLKRRLFQKIITRI